MCEKIFNDRRIITLLLAVWTFVSSAAFYWIMVTDHSPFLQFGPNNHTKLFGVAVDTWGKWWVVTIYTFVSTGIAAFASDSIAPFITNTVQDHKTVYIPYSKGMCLLIIQIFTTYSVVVSIIGLFVALTQVDFTIVRLLSDLIINHVTTAYFLRGKVVNAQRYHAWQESQKGRLDVIDDDDTIDVSIDDIEISTTPDDNSVLMTTVSTMREDSIKPKL